MATLNQRITALEQQTPCEIFTAHQLATCTEDELLGIFLAFPFSNVAHEEYIQSITNSEVARHGNA